MLRIITASWHPKLSTTRSSFSILLKPISKQASKFRISGLMTGGFPTPRDCKEESVSISWHHQNPNSICMFLLDRSRSRYDPNSVTVEKVHELTGYDTASENSAKSLSIRSMGDQPRAWSTQSSLARTLMWTFGGYYVYTEILQMMFIVLTFLRPSLQQ